MNADDLTYPRDAMKAASRQIEEMKHAIIVWYWDDAPEHYRELSTHGGDEDWVGFVPEGMPQPSWMSEGSSFGCCSVSEHVVPGGMVYIGAHA